MISYWGVDHGQEIAKAKRKPKREFSGTAVGTGSTVSGLGLLGGGVPGARPNSGRIAHIQRGTKIEATRHLVSATRGGIFGYRADAHQSFLNRQNADERAHGGAPTSRVNHFWRGVGAGKIKPEEQIVRHMKRGRAASNVALVGGAALAGAGLLDHRKKQQAIQKALKRRDNHKTDSVIAAGTTTAVGAGGGSLAMDVQGRKWSARSAASLDAARKINPNMGGYEIKRTRKRRFLPPTGSRVPDVVPNRSNGDIGWNQKTLFAGRSSKATEAAGRLRGAAGQERYFAKVYGSTARTARKAGVAGALVAGAGIGHKYYEVNRRKR